MEVNNWREADAVMREAYVRRLAKLIASLSASACRGCRADHPSQLRHDVCLLRKETLVDRLFEEAVSSIAGSDIVADWQKIVKFCNFVRFIDDRYVGVA